jgi:uncharacterized protein
MAAARGRGPSGRNKNMEITPILAPGRQSIERYGPSGFRISGVVWAGPVLVFPDRTEPWAVTDAAAIDLDSFAPVVAHGGIEILLLGLGRRMAAVPPALRSGLRRRGIALEPMDTGAACRTYSLLLGEDRRVAAALIPPV